MKKIFYLTLFISLISCATRKSQLPRDVESQFNYAMELYNEGKYSKAIEIFKNIVFNYPTSQYVDKAQYYLAKSYKESHDCLLYTSPSPRDISGSRMPSSA